MGQRHGGPDTDIVTGGRPRVARVATDVRSPWAEPLSSITAALGVDPGIGLTGTEAAKRLAEHGPNELLLTPPRALIDILVKQFASVLVALLAAAALLSLLLGQWAEAIAVVAVLVLNAGIGFFTELRAVRSVESLRSLGTASTTVRREGHLQEIPVTAVVPGDVLVLTAGDVVAADARVCQSWGLRTDESALTGESLASDKRTDPVSPESELHARSSQVFKGTAVAHGSGEAVVTHTGMDTELGSIAALVDTSAPPSTPLEEKLDRLGRGLVWVTLIVAVVVAASGIGSGKSWLLLVQTAIALAVATIPEGLPVIATLTLARGVGRMAARNALVDRLAAVETLGATSVIFTDKTGTLTENRMTVATLRLPDGLWARGAGGEFSRDGLASDAVETGGLLHALSVASLCTSADLTGETGVGDPLELAILEAARGVGITRTTLLEDFPELDVAAFDADTMMMATLHGTPAGAFLVTVKGAPGAVIRACRSVAVAPEDGHSAPATTLSTPTRTRALSEEGREVWLQHNRSMAESGLRVLALAERHLSTRPSSESTDTGDPDADTGPYRHLTLLGLIAFRDPPRADVTEALMAARTAGIRVVMLTGDQAVTAAAVAASVGLAPAGAEVLVGAQLTALLEGSEADRRRVLDTAIMARVSPEQKLRLIEAHQATGAIVAMTGDGVNDAPALKRADIGVAMGKRGTDVAREAADMVLTDDAFSTIVAAVREGRVIFDNIRAFVVYLLSCNLSEVLVIGLAATLGYPLPLLPLQILFINLVTDVLPALALGNGDGDASVMTRQPRPPDEPVLTMRHWRTVAGYAALLTISVLVAFVIALEVLGFSESQATTVSFSAVALAQVLHVFNMREPGSGLLRNSVTRNRLVWVATIVCSTTVLLVNAWQPLRQILSLVPLPLEGWALVAVAALVPAVLGQVGKAFGLGKVA